MLTGLSAGQYHVQQVVFLSVHFLTQFLTVFVTVTFTPPVQFQLVWEHVPLCFRHCLRRNNTMSFRYLEHRAQRNPVTPVLGSAQK